MKTFLSILSGIALAGLPLAGITPETGEFLARGLWAEQAFGLGAAASNAASLKILFEDTADGLTRGRSWRGGPYQLGEKQYTHGLAFNATKHLLVRLGQPGARFRVEVGLENNDDTQRGAASGNGSVTFHVLVGGKEVFTSPVRRLKDGPQTVDVPLDGAPEFVIRVKDGGDGRGWDQAVWAEAVIELKDGRKLRLQDLPWADCAGGQSARLLVPLWRQADRADAGPMDTQGERGKAGRATHAPAGHLAGSRDRSEN